VVTHGDTPSTPPRLHITLLQRFGATLRQYRQQRGLTQKALATSIGIRRSSYLSEIELGKRNITVLTLLHLAHALDMSATALLTGLDLNATLAPPVARHPRPHRGANDARLTPDSLPHVRPHEQTTPLQLLGTTLRHYRQQQGFTHKILAAKTGLDNSYIGEIERGERNVSVLNVVRIADALGLSVSHLLAPLDLLQSPAPRPPA
jgi:transcriptional regulator with XRE-family HTH domain